MRKSISDSRVIKKRAREAFQVPLLSRTFHATPTRLLFTTECHAKEVLGLRTETRQMVQL